MSDLPPAPPLAERERNRLLRRVDWRFLLSRPRVERLLCFAPGDLREGVELMANHVAGPGAVGGGNYQLAVAVDASDRDLETLSDALAPDGELYSEWSVGVAGRDDVQTRLTAVGFSDNVFYWPWPEPPLAEAWVPLDAPQAFDYYLGIDRHVYSGLRHRLGTRARRMAAKARLVAGRAGPLCVVSRKAGTRPSDSPDRACMLLTGGPRAISKVVGAVFDGGAKHPEVIIKWPRVEESEAGLLREADALAACHVNGIAEGVPRLIARSTSNGTIAVAETAARGVPMFTLLRRRNYAALSCEGESWLGRFAANHRGVVAEPASWQRRTTKALARFVETFGPVIDEGIVRETMSLVAQLGHVAPVIEHRDFGPWNIFIDDDRRLTVLDWESSDLRGLPLLDLIYFVTYMAFFLDGTMASRRFAESYRATLDPRSFTGAIRSELLERHQAALGLTSATARALRALCWIGHAESEFQHYSADAAGWPAPDALRASVFVQLWQEEIRDLCK